MLSVSTGLLGLVKVASNSPTEFSDNLRKMIGPCSVMLTTVKIDRTTTKTEQNERQNWHLCIQISFSDCFKKNLNFCQHVSPLTSSSFSKLEC